MIRRSRLPFRLDPTRSFVEQIDKHTYTLLFESKSLLRVVVPNRPADADTRLIAMIGKLKISDSTPPLPPSKQLAPTIKPAAQQIAEASSVESISYHRSSDASIAAPSNSDRVPIPDATSSAAVVTSPNDQPHDPNEARPSLFQLPKPRVSPELKISHRTNLSDSQFPSEAWHSLTSSRDKEDSVLDTTTLIDDLVAQAEASEHFLEADSIDTTNSFHPKTPQWVTTLGGHFNRTIILARNTLQDSPHSSRVLRWSAVGVTALLLVWGGNHLFGSADNNSVRVAEEGHRPQAMGQKASYDSGSNKRTSAFVATPKAIEDDHSAVPAEDPVLVKADSASTMVPGGVVATVDGSASSTTKTLDQNAASNEESIVDETPLTNIDSSEQTRTQSNSRKSIRSGRKKSKQPSTTKETAPTKANNSATSSNNVVTPHRDTPDAKSLLAKARKSHGLQAYQLAQRSYKINPTKSSLVIMARAACEIKNTRTAKSAYNKLPFGKHRRSVRSTCRKLGVKVGF